MSYGSGADESGSGADESGSGADESGSGEPAGPPPPVPPVGRSCPRRPPAEGLRPGLTWVLVPSPGRGSLPAPRRQSLPLVVPSRGVPPLRGFAHFGRG